MDKIVPAFETTLFDPTVNNGELGFFRKYPFSLLNIQNCVIRYRQIVLLSGGNLCARKQVLICDTSIRPI